MESLTDVPRLEACDLNENVHSKESQPHRNVLRIMVVEDNIDAADLLAEFLEMQGQEVRVLYQAPESLEIVSQFAPHIFVIDIELPGINGCEFLQKIRTLPETTSSKFIAFSGYEDIETRRSAIQAGFHKYLVKPCDANILFDVIEDYVESTLA